jgi:hypothetical protein
MHFLVHTCVSPTTHRSWEDSRGLGPKLRVWLLSSLLFAHPGASFHLRGPEEVPHCCTSTGFDSVGMFTQALFWFYIWGKDLAMYKTTGAFCKAVVLNTLFKSSWIKGRKRRLELLYPFTLKWSPNDNNIAELTMCQTSTLPTWSHY